MELFAKASKLLTVTRAIAAARLAGLGRSGRISYLDIGARGGLPPRWQLAYRANLLAPIFVDADTTEATRLSAKYPGAPVIAEPLGSEDGAHVPLFLTREPGLSSVLEPDATAIASVEKDTSPWDVIERRSLTVRRLDRVWQPAWASPDFVKVDVQGYELNVLDGMGPLLAGVRGIEMEVSLLSMYRGQPKIGDVYEYMHAAGFDLVKLACMGLYGGRSMVEFNSFWVRRNLHEDPWVRFWKGVNDVGDARRVVVWGY